VAPKELESPSDHERVQRDEAITINSTFVALPGVMAGTVPPIMTNPIRNLHKRDTREAMVRSVVDIAREVRVHLQGEQVIFGSIAQAAERCDGSFRIRPWGMKQSIELRFADVTLATPVKQMGWDQHRAIARAQQAGVFTAVRKMLKSSLRDHDSDKGEDERVGAGSPGCPTPLPRDEIEPLARK
jgi:hypothetical protein